MNTSLVEFGKGLFCRVQPGEGEKVLWIHGYTMDSSLWLDLWQQLEAWQHIGLDLPYHGASPVMPPAYTLSSLAQMIGELALAQGVRHLVGLSLGAIITLQVAMEYPDSFQSVTLGSASINGGPNDPHAGPHYWRLMKLYKSWGAGPWMTNLWMKWPPDIFKGAANHPELWKRLQDVINRHSWEEFRTLFMEKLMGEERQIDHMDRIERIVSPVLLLVGEEEMPAFKQAAALLEETLPHCECVYLPEAGHLCLLEQPAASAAVIGRHLRKGEVAAQ